MSKKSSASKLKLIHHIKSVNKYLTDKWIEKQDILTLLNCAHPAYRKELASEFGYGFLY